MPPTTAEISRPVHQFVIDNSHGKVTVRVNNEALVALGAALDEESRTATLERHMPRLRALAMQLAGSRRSGEITIRSADIWWSSWRR
jgi:hypothetical protein